MTRQYFLCKRTSNNPKYTQCNDKKNNFVPVGAIGDPGEKLHIRLPAILSEVGVKRPKQVFQQIFSRMSEVP